MAVILPVDKLDYPGLREGLIAFLKGQTAYKDWNFDASGVGTIANILSYNSAQFGFFVKMLLDEAFVDSAHTREAQLSHAKRTSYIPKGNRSARAEVVLEIRVQPGQEPTNDYISIPRWSSFSAANSQMDSRSFQLTQDAIARNRRTNPDGSQTYYTDGLTVYEGTAERWKFKVDQSIVNQRFVIRDPSVDIDTLTVFVKTDDAATNFDEFTLAKFTDRIDRNSKVFYVTTNEDGFYQIFFGDDVFGMKPPNGASIEARYVATNAESGNGAKNFLYNPPPPDFNVDHSVGNFSDFTVLTNSPSSGGMPPETVDSMRFTIPNHWRRQNRVVTETDYAGVLMEEFRNIQSMNVWGGEKSDRREYGKVFCSIKPKNALYLTNAAKTEIKERIIEMYGIVGGDVLFVDPEYINVDLTVYIRVDRRKTSLTFSDISYNVSNRISRYNADVLGRFAVDLSENDLVNAARGEDTYLGIYTKKTMWKMADVFVGGTGVQEVRFYNPTVVGSVFSESFAYGGKRYHYQERGGKLYLIDDATGKEGFAKSFGSVNHDTGAIEFTFPQYATIEGFAGPNARLKFTSTPTEPDIITSQNNITRIGAIKPVEQRA